MKDNERIGFVVHGIAKTGCQVSHCNKISAIRFVVLIICLTILSFQPGTASNYGVIKENLNATDTQGYTAISVCVDVLNFGGTEMQALFYKGSAYLPVTALFDFLKIKNVASPNFDSIQGFIVDEQDIYVIDKTTNHIYYRKKNIIFNDDDLIRTEREVYMKLSYFNEIFGIECQFNFRSLSVIIKTIPDLPITRAIRRVTIQQDMKDLRGEKKADTIIKPQHSWFHLGMADWSIVNMQQQGMSNDMRANLNLGIALAGGSASIGINYFNNSAFNSRQQYYLWRYVDNDHKMLRQLSLGRIIHRSTASIYAPVVGIQFTNAPTIPRRSFGSYRLTDITKPGWMVELYINNVLADYTQADASGFFSFEVPMIFGSFVVKLRFYGPWGEEYSRIKSVYIPFSFLPKKEFEYTVSAALVEDNTYSRFSKISTVYGLTRHITIGGGMEYLSSVSSGAFMPFMNVAIGAGTRLLFSGEYTHGVRNKGIINYRLPANAWLELNYTRYSKGQTAIIYNYLEDRKATLFFPFSVFNINGATRLSLNQAILPGGMKYTTGEWSFSGNTSRISLNINTFTSSLGRPSTDNIYPNSYWYSNASLTLKCRKGFMLTTQGQYGYTNNEIVSVRCAVEKTVCSKGVINISYEQNLKSNIRGLNIGLKYDFALARLSLTARQYNNTVSFVQSARGSLIYDSKTHYLEFNNRTSVGKAGITFIPFLDFNGNGRKDSNEFKVQGLKVKMNGGRILTNQEDTLIQVYDLNPYVQYNVDLSQNSFEDITFQVLHKTISIFVLPNHVQIVEIPVIRKCDVSGTIYLMKDGKSKDITHLKLNFYNEDNSLAGYTYTEPDGSYYYSELLPGYYTVQIDNKQLEQLKLKASPKFLPIRINSIKENNRFDFILEENIPKPVKNPRQRE